MRNCSVLVLMIALVLMPFAASAVSPQANDNVQMIASSQSDIPDLNRDDADNDSLYIFEGFEDDWNGWTTVDLTDIDPMWHVSENHGFENNSWWCSNEDLDGYDNHWLQYLMTPELDLRQYDGQAVTLTFKLYYASEVAADAEAPYDAWDGSNVWISADAGDSWEVFTPESPAYTNESLFSFGDIWGYGADIAGWCGSSDGWVDAEFDLSEYAGMEGVIVRWAFCSDDGWSSIDDDEGDAYGFIVDDIAITADGEGFFSNNADDDGDADEMVLSSGAIAGDFWELTDANPHTGDFSAHCPIEPMLLNALVSPPLEIPGDPWYTYFDFWIHADGRNYSPDGGDGLADYYTVEYSTDQITWEKVFHDYGRNETWWDDYHFYGPDTSYAAGHDTEWGGKLNLTGFGGETIWLRWVVKTDAIMGNNEGSGFWLDDFRINITARHEFDAAIDYVSVPFPVAMNFRTRCSMKVSNQGINDLGQVQHFFRINDFTDVPVTPWDGIDADSSAIYYFIFNDNAPSMLPFADVVNVTGSLVTAQDGDGDNDEFLVEDITVYPENIWVMGYDNRTNPFAFNFDEGFGPAVYCTPQADGIEDNFDIKAIRVKWNGLQVDQVDVTLHIFADTHDRVPGDEIYSEEITVQSAQSNPYTHVIYLTDVNEVQNMSENFWVWFELTNADGIPSPTGDNAHPNSKGHYFNFGGNTLEVWDREFLINPVVMPTGMEGNTLASGREDVDFDVVPPGDELIIPVAVYNGGTEMVTVQSIRAEGAGFTVGFDDDVEIPAFLEIGDMIHCWAAFRPNANGEYEGTMTVRGTADENLVIQLMGIGDDGGSVPGDGSQPVEFALGEAFPNPFNAHSVIPFSIPNSGSVKLAVFDLNGREVATLVNRNMRAGNHSIVFDGQNFATGVYVYRLDFEGMTAFSKLALVK